MNGTRPEHVRTTLLSQAVAANVRRVMRERGVTLLELSGASGLSVPVFLGRYRGLVPWQLDELPAVAEYLRVDLHVLLEVDDLVD